MKGLNVRMLPVVGRVVEAIEGMAVDSEDVVMVFTDGAKLRMHHEQDCCEGVSITDVTGDVADLIGQRLVMAEEVSYDATRDPAVGESGTWTFYRFASAKGDVVVRWLGESNGYYSETVNTVLEDAQGVDLL